jgi:hypothetical protein
VEVLLSYSKLIKEIPHKSNDDSCQGTLKLLTLARLIDKKVLIRERMIVVKEP